MESGKNVRNETLTALLRQAEKGQCDRDRQRWQKVQEAKLNNEPVIRQSLFGNHVKEAKKLETPEKQPALVPLEAEELRTEAIPFTLDEIEWLDGVFDLHGHANMMGVVGRLVEWAHTEPPEAKKKLFLQVRCRRCSAGAKGGVKRDCQIELPSRLWQWLENVKVRSKHASVGKTLRIIVDFYMPLCKEDSSFEQKLLRAGCVTKSDRHDDAVNNVDPTLALKIQFPLRGLSRWTTKEVIERQEKVQKAEQARGYLSELQINEYSVR
jgi:hypothetical protein